MLPPTLNLAHISLILKMDKPPVVCSSYRPISLLWVDCKIVSKLLARRLEEVLPIWSDQIRQDLSRVGAPTRMSDGYTIFSKKFLLFHRMLRRHLIRWSESISLMF